MTRKRKNRLKDVFDRFERRNRAEKRASAPKQLNDWFEKNRLARAMMEEVRQEFYDSLREKEGDE